MKPLGIALIVAACLVPLVWLPGIAQGRDVVALFSQYLGIVALITMALAHLIATRWPGIEATFGPMDQSYRVHKWLGIAGMTAVLLHDTIDADMSGLGRETALVELGETLGEISLYGLLILVVITIATFIPYHLWKWTHRLIGIFFVFGALHYLLILKPFANTDPLGLYTGAFCVLGLIAFLYTSAPRALRPARDYAIESVTPEGRAIAVEMTPSGRAMKHHAGQFGFFAFTGGGLPEPHPFTFSSAPRTNGSLRVTIAPLGDLTNRLTRSLAPGQTVRVEGPYGHFGRHITGPQVWIGAGVGITPFMALAEALAPDAAPVVLIHAVKRAEDAPHRAALEALAADKPNLTFILWESSTRGRLNADTLVETAGALDETHVLFCGPANMRDSLSQGLRRHGVPQKRFHYELFEIRTGIGLEALAKWIWARRGALAKVQKQSMRR